MKLIGIAGTDGSGKDSLGEYLRDKHGWAFLSVTDLLRDEAKRRGIELGRHTLREISAEWRREHGLGVLVDRAVDSHKLEKIQNDSGGLVLASLRNPGEADKVHELGGIVVWVDADPKVRFERIKKRNRGSEDHVTFEQFTGEEKAQSQHQGDEATLSLNGVKAKANIVLENSGENIEEFKDQASKALAEYI